MTAQFGRKVGLYLYAPPKQVDAEILVNDPGATPQLATVSGTQSSGDVLDLSQMQLEFVTSQSDFETPNTCFVRVWNLSDRTARLIMNQSASGPEYTRFVLQAGYVDGNYGVIFDGTIKQVRRGRASAVDTYLDIFGGDGDIAYNFAVNNTTLEGPATQTKVLDQLVASLRSAQSGVNVIFAPDVSLGPVLPRGKVLFGMAKDSMRDFSSTNFTTWSLQDGMLQVNKMNGYLPGEAVVMNSKSGMIGVPEQTNDGIRIRTLINAKLKVGGLVQIDNKSIQAQLIDPRINFGSPNNLAYISDDGFYKALVIEHTGNTRGQEWYSDLTCLAVDLSAPAGQQVQPYG